MSRSRFGGIQATRMQGAGGQYFTNGLHLCRVDRIKFFEDATRKERCAIEFTVLKTIELGPEGEEHRPGTEVSKLWDTRDIWFLGQFKQFACVMLDIAPEDADDEITPEVCDQISDEEDQPLAGELVTVFGYPKTFQSGKTGTVTIFKSHVPHSEAAALLGDDADMILAKCYRESKGFKSLADFNERAAG